MRCPCSRHRNDNSIAAEAQHQPLALRMEMQDNATLILEPEITTAHIADCEAIAGLSVGAGKLRQRRQLVDFPCRADGGGADAADAQTADVEWIGLPSIEERAGAATTTCQIRDLDLMHINRGIRREAGDRLRSDFGGRLAAAEHR